MKLKKRVCLYNRENKRMRRKKMQTNAESETQGSLNLLIIAL